MDGDVLITLPAGRDGEGGWVHEQLEAEPLEAGAYRLRHSPGLVPGVAAGDVVRIISSEAFEVVERSGNLAIWVYGPDGHDQVTIDELTPRLKDLGGRLDGGAAGKLVIFTVPVDAGFPAIEQVLDHYVERHPETEWFFGNVYVDGGETPIGWWEE